MSRSLVDVIGRVLRLSELTEEDLARWRALGDGAVEVNPLLEPACLLPAMRFLPDGDRIELLVAEEDGVFFGCLPLGRSRWGRDRMAPTPLELLGRGYTTQVRRNRYDLTPLMLSERMDETWATLLGAVSGRKSARRIGFLRLESLDLGGPVEAAPRRATHGRGTRVADLSTWSRPIKSRSAGEGGRFQTGGKPKNDRKLRQDKRKLGDRIGGEVHLVDRSEDPGAIEDVFRLERSGYKFATGVAVESFEGEAKWLVDSCDELRRQGRLLVFSLEAATTVVATVVFFRAGSRLLGIHRVYDEQYGEYSPGVLLDLEIFAALNDIPGIDLVDSCSGVARGRTLSRFSETRPVGTLVIATGGPLHSAALSVYLIARRPFIKALDLLRRRRGLWKVVRHWTMRLTSRAGASSSRSRLDRARRRDDASHPATEEASVEGSSRSGVVLPEAGTP
jgi:CelD/BcsL family acetyltransferase involved in cellulose biosynthesis